MRRGFHYVLRYMMIRNRLEKNVFRAYYIGLPIFITLVFLSCAPVSHDYIGTWNCQPDKLTYVNYDQHIKLTFPNDKWEVHTKPPHGAMGRGWKRPTYADPSYNVMQAIFQYGQYGLLMMQVRITPVSIEMSLNELLSKARASEARAKSSVQGVETISSEVVEHNNRTIGLEFCKWKVTHKERSFYAKMMTVTFKEKGRFIILNFVCPEADYKSQKYQFWAIVDSYEYID